MTNNEMRHEMMDDQRKRDIGLEYLNWLLSAEAAVCDHEWVAEGYGGPESGWIGGECSKCGTTYHYTLY
jgi:hypothetical protein